MRSLTCSHDFVDYTMLLGAYEKELHPFVTEIQHSGFHTMLEIGSAQGYYAVGFALLCPELRIITFESNPTAREQIDSRRRGQRRCRSNYAARQLRSGRADKTSERLSSIA